MRRRGWEGPAEPGGPGHRFNEARPHGDFQKNVPPLNHGPADKSVEVWVQNEARIRARKGTRQTVPSPFPQWIPHPGAQGDETARAGRLALQIGLPVRRGVRRQGDRRGPDAAMLSWGRTLKQGTCLSRRSAGPLQKALRPPS